MSQNIVAEAKQICNAIRAGFPSKWDGRDCILELKEADYQWRQMEWIGWYFEYKATDILSAQFGRSPGPKFGSTAFDFKLSQVWDFKAHLTNSSTHPWVIINDKEAIDNCISRYGGVGVVIAEGEAEYDDSAQSFKQWHDSLKGKRSNYEVERIRRGATSRQRKKAFNFQKLEAYWFNKTTITEGLKEKWVNFFQQGMRNADGSSRRAKYMVDLNAVSTEARLVSV
jgi:cytochrome b involved in lipid metabolism